MSTPFDLVVIGAGPAGMAAAIEARTRGLAVAVVDQQHEPGGQIYRAVERVARTRPDDLALLGTHYAHGAGLVARFRAADVDYRPAHTVWRIDPGTGVHVTDGESARLIAARHVLIACGALERPLPVPGWTLPGVMGAGAAQILLKSSRLVPDGPVVLAGAGPLLLLVAAQLSAAGATVSAVLEFTRTRDYLRAAPWLPAALRAREYLAEGLALRRRLRAAGVALHGGVSSLALRGGARVESVGFTCDGRNHELDARVVLLHDGVAPHTQLARQAGCEHEWLPVQRHFRPVRDAFGATGVDGVHVAGDCGGILGARVAEAQGALAALDVAMRCVRLDPDQRDAHAQHLLGEAARHGAIRPLLDRLFAPALPLLARPHDDTVVCRCEEITAREVRAAVALGATGANQLKAYTRCGMGPCQARMCGLTVTEIIARERGVPPAAVDPIRVRPPLVPITLGELAGTQP